MTVIDRTISGSSGGTDGTSGTAGGPDGVSDIDDAAAQAFWLAHPQRRLRELAVVIAAYNEEGGIADVLRAMPAVVRGLGVDVIVVVDGATDRTAKCAAAGPGDLVAVLPVNQGQGAALRLRYRTGLGGGGLYELPLGRGRK